MTRCRVGFWRTARKTGTVVVRSAHRCILSRFPERREHVVVVICVGRLQRTTHPTWGFRFWVKTRYKALSERKQEKASRQGFIYHTAGRDD